MSAASSLVSNCAHECVCVFQGILKMQTDVYPGKRGGGIEWPACCSVANSDKTVPYDATVSRNTEGHVFLGISLWPLTALVSTTSTQQCKLLSGAKRQITLRGRMCNCATVLSTTTQKKEKKKKKIQPLKNFYWQANRQPSSAQNKVYEAFSDLILDRETHTHKNTRNMSVYTHWNRHPHMQAGPLSCDVISQRKANSSDSDKHSIETRKEGVNHNKARVCVCVHARASVCVCVWGNMWTYCTVMVNWFQLRMSDFHKQDDRVTAEWSSHAKRPCRPCLLVSVLKPSHN